MNRTLMLAFCLVGLRAVAVSQSDPLGPHDVNGHGCILCHVPSAAADAFPFDSADVFWPRASATPEQVNGPGTLGDDRPLFHTFVCLTCHDGGLARLGTMGGARDRDRGLLQPNSTTVLSDDSHPVHVPYLPNDGCDIPSPTCNPDHWPSRVDPKGGLTWVGDKASEYFDTVYGRPARFYPTAENGGRAMVECSTCHNPHSLQRVQFKFQGKVQSRPSKAFLRGWYETEGKFSDSASRFCRSCHFDKASDFVNVRQ